MKYFALVHSIRTPQDDLATAAFRRCTALRQEAGICTTVLTFDEDPDFPEIVRESRSRGELADTMVRNLICDMVDSNVRRAIATGSAHPTSFAVVPPRPPAVIPEDVQAYATFEADATVHFFDAEGNRFLVHEKRPGNPGGARYSVFAPSSDQVVFQGSLHALTEAWVDVLIAGDPAILVFDDPRVGSDFSTWVRPGVGKVFVHHTHHLDRPADSADPAELKTSHVEIYRNSGSFDSIVCQTNHQAEDLSRRFDPATRLNVIPESVTPPRKTSPGHRNPRVVVVRATHASSRGTEQAIRAFELAHHRQHVDRLTVLGVPRFGPVAGDVKNLVSELGLDKVTTCRPLEPGALELYEATGPAVFTDLDVGAMTQLGDAMARGAVPVATVSGLELTDLIVEGETGFLAPDGDVDALAEKIAYSATAGPDDPMRTRARESTRNLSTRTVARRWTRLFTRIEADFDRRDALADVVPELQKFEFTDAGVLIRLRYDVDSFEGLDFTLAVEGETSLRHISVERTGISMNKVLTFMIPVDYRDVIPDERIDVWFTVRSADVGLRHRLTWPSDWTAAHISVDESGGVMV